MTEDLTKSEPPSEAVAEPARPEAEAADIPLLRIEAVVKRFGGFRAVDRLSLDIRAGEFFALLGPSGCGKTTLLRMLAGFETPDEGRILLDGWDIAPMLPHERPVNMMFQNYALFPHLSVRDNIAFGLKRAGMAAADIRTRVAEMMALVKLEGLEKRKPDHLSGGQLYLTQHVAFFDLFIQFQRQRVRDVEVFGIQLGDFSLNSAVLLDRHPARPLIHVHLDGPFDRPLQRPQRL